MTTITAPTIPIRQVTPHTREHSSTMWTRQIAALEPISLHDINETAALQQRVDRKYIVTPQQWAELSQHFAQAPRVLDIDGKRVFQYSSTYYDTPEWDLFLAAAYRRPQRYKVRMRCYVDTGDTAIEVKQRARTGDTVKHRQFLVGAIPLGSVLTAQARSFVESFPELQRIAGTLEPALTTQYVRTTLLTDDARITVDANVRGITPHGKMTRFTDRLIVETKSASRAGSVDRLLWAHGVRPLNVSKYCTSLASLRPELPHNRWSRTLRHHVSPTASARAEM